MDSRPQAKPAGPTYSLSGLGLGASAAIFLSASLVLLLGTRVLIPALNATFGLEMILGWFLVGGLGVFLPLLITGAIILKSEGWFGQAGLWRERLRFRPMNRSDWLWTLGAMVFVGLLSFGLMEGLKAFFGEFSSQPSFMAMEPFTGVRLWLFAAWVPYWLLNIMGEEIFWRGVLLPRQEKVFGRWTWLIHGTGWTLFHIAFGWNLLIILLPLLYIQSYVVQRRKNSWIGVILHGGLNGPSFIMLALDLM